MNHSQHNIKMPYLHLDKCTYLISGRQEVEVSAMNIAVSFLARGEKVFWVDGGNSFNPYMLTESAKRLNVNPLPLLRRLFVARAFTVHQLVSMIIRHLVPALDKHHDALGVIYDPLSMCRNPDVPKTEADRAVKQIVLEVKRIQKKGYRLIVAIPVVNNQMFPPLEKGAKFIPPPQIGITGGGQTCPERGRRGECWQWRFLGEPS